MTSYTPELKLTAGMRPFASYVVRRLTATTAFAAIAVLALGFCLCEMPMPREVETCHESAEAQLAAVTSGGAWSSDCCCSDELRMLPGTLESRAPEAQRGGDLLAAASAFTARHAPLDVASSPLAPSWLVAASPPHAPPPAFVLPLRV